MRLAELAAAVVVWAPAKVNFFLEVLGKRADGYHEIATLMATVRSLSSPSRLCSASLTL